MSPPSAAALEAVGNSVLGLLLGAATLHLIKANLRWPWGGGKREELVVIGSVGIGTALVLQYPRGYGLLPLITFGVAASAIDLSEQRLPDPLTGGLAAAAAGAVLVDWVMTGQLDAAARGALVAGAVVMIALAIKLVRTAMLGWGDVKFLQGLAATLGWWDSRAIFSALFLWGVFILAASIIVGLRQRRTWTVVPYGPPLLLGTLGALAVVT